MKKRTLGAVVLSSSLLISSTAWTANTAIQPMQLGDNAKTCAELITEAQAMEQIIGGAPEGGLFSSEQAINASTGLAQSAAIPNDA